MKDDLLIVDNSLHPEFYRPLDHWRAAGARAFAAVRPPAGEALPDPGRFRHVILTGSECSIVTPPAWAFDEAAWLRQAVRRGARVLGSCFGHQLIALALGSRACVRRAARPEFGWIPLDLAGDWLLPPGGYHAFAAHFDEVVESSHAELRAAGASPDCRVQFLRWGALPVFGMQAHPEIGPEEGADFLRRAERYFPETADRFAAALAGPMRDNRLAPRILEAFLAL
jgi:GMP synthase-like glutamine amidotransferase